MTDLGKQKLLRVINVDLTKVYILLMDTLLLSQLLIESDIVMQLFCWNMMKMNDYARRILKHKSVNDEYAEGFTHAKLMRYASDDQATNIEVNVTSLTHKYDKKSYLLYFLFIC